MRAKMMYDATKTTKPKNDLELGSLRLKITKTEIRSKSGRILNLCPSWNDSNVDGNVLVHVIREQILSKLPGSSEILVYGRATILGQTYNANPSANVAKQAKQEWGYVDMGDDGVVPCQLLCVLRINDKPTSDIILNNSRIDEPGAYFIAHVALSALTESGPSLHEDYKDNQDEGTLAHVDQKLIHRIPKAHYDGKQWRSANHDHPPSLLFVDTRSIVSPCIAFPDILCENSKNEFFFIRPVAEWASLFEEEAKNHARQ